MGRDHKTIRRFVAKKRHRREGSDTKPAGTIVLQRCRGPQAPPTWSVNRYQGFTSQGPGQGGRLETQLPPSKATSWNVKKDLKTDSSKVLWTDETRETRWSRWMEVGGWTFLIIVHIRHTHTHTHGG